MLQLHIGALTLRIDPAALSELFGTLARAMAAHTVRCLPQGILAQAGDA
jgi:hypothetical protein